MIVSKKHQKVVLNLNNPAKVTTVVPGAQLLKFKGRSLVAVPHHLDTTRILRNIGLDVPNPMRYYYDWPGRVKPFSHQIETADFLTMHPRAYCLNDMGTGKTLSVLWAYDYLRSINAVTGAMLVVGPLSTLESVWADEVFKHFIERNVAVLHGTSDRRIALAQDDADIYVINHDGLKNKRLLAQLVERVRNGSISVLTIDELATYRNQHTARWKALHELAHRARYVWGLTGTPIPNEPTDAYGQIKMIIPSAVPKYYGTFRDAVMRQKSTYVWEAREDALDYVFSIMRPAIRFKRADCLDLPPTTHRTNRVEMTDEQKSAYRQMMNKLRVEHEQGTITALNEATAVGKLLQIACGVAYGDNGDVLIPAEQRIELTKELIEQSDGKVIVFVPFVGALNYLADALTEDFSVRIVHGGVNKTERTEIFRAFQDRLDPRVIVAQPGTMSHGLNLTAASTIIWFAPINSSEIYQQACERITRPGQKRNTLIVHIEASPVERRMYKRLERRQSTQGLLLEMFEEVDKVT